MGKDYYTILGVLKNASDKEIKSAFRRLALLHHPDKKSGDAAKFREVSEAYVVLSDPKERARYDKEGPERFSTSERTAEYRQPTWEELQRLFNEWFSTETPFDNHVRGYPRFYFGGTVTDPHTGDEYSSAQDIRIAKSEQAAVEWERQISRIKKSAYRDLWPSSRLRELAELLRQEKWISEEEFKDGLDAIGKYEVWERKEGEHYREGEKWDHFEILGESVQEGIEQKGIHRRATGKYGKQQGGDRSHRDEPDPRKEWRRDFGKIG